MICRAARSKEWVCGRTLAGIAGSNPAGAWMSASFVCVCGVLSIEVSATGRSLVQRNSIERVCVIDCDQVRIRK
jgi:hypothetical protein